MIKLRSSIAVKKIILASSFLIAPTLAFSSESYEDQVRPTDEQLQMMQEFAHEGEFSTYSIEPKSQQGSQALMGEWNISYNYNDPQTDKIVINDTFTSDNGRISAIGSYYPNQTGEKQPILCLDEDSVYTCISDGANVVGFLFSISGNSIDAGFFATASSLDNLSFDSQYPITGSRGGDPVTPEPVTSPPDSIDPDASEANFDDVTNELTIPVLDYNGSKYSVVLENEGNFGKLLFSVKEAKPLN